LPRLRGRDCPTTQVHYCTAKQIKLYLHHRYGYAQATKPKEDNMITTNQYGHKLVTIQLTLGEDDIEALRIAGEQGDDPVLTGICEHIVEQAKLVEGKE
jgi:hypothetical protein